MFASKLWTPTISLSPGSMQRESLEAHLAISISRAAMLLSALLPGASRGANQRAFNHGTKRLTHLASLTDRSADAVHNAVVGTRIPARHVLVGGGGDPVDPFDCSDDTDQLFRFLIGRLELIPADGLVDVLPPAGRRASTNLTKRRQKSFSSGWPPMS